MTRFSREYAAKLAEEQDRLRRSTAIGNAWAVVDSHAATNRPLPATTKPDPSSVPAGSGTTQRKYRNVPTGGYHSKKEAGRASELKVGEALGDIRHLREQVEYLLIPKQDGERAVKYVADFVYEQDGATVVEDCKGMRTPDYVIKRKLMLFVQKIRIRET